MFIPKNWRLKPQRYQLQGGVDQSGNVEFPARPTVKQRLLERYEFQEITESLDSLQELAS